MRVMKAVLALPPAVRREEEEAEEVAPAGVRRPRLEQRVVGEVVKERVHPHQEHRRDEPEADREPRARLDSRRHDPHPEVGTTTLAICAEAAPAVDLEIGGEVALPAGPAWDLGGGHGRGYVPAADSDQSPSVATQRAAVFWPGAADAASAAHPSDAKRNETAKPFEVGPLRCPFYSRAFTRSGVARESAGFAGPGASPSGGRCRTNRSGGPGRCRRGAPPPTRTPAG